MPPRRRRVPDRARHLRAARAGRLDLRPLAARERRADRTRRPNGRGQTARAGRRAREHRPRADRARARARAGARGSPRPMIAFGVAITRPDVYRACAEPGIRRAAEPDSAVDALPAAGTIFESYNALLDRAAAVDALEALVLVHQDTEIVSADLCATIRKTLSDPAVGVIGCVGAIGVRSIAWWEASVTLASFINRYPEHGGGDLHSFSWNWGDAPAYAHVGEVETLDGFALVLAPWTVRN